MTKEKFRRIRKKHNLKQGELAEIIGVARKTICTYETGLRRITKPVATLMKNLDGIIAGK